jgi:hypothetical protein
MRHRLHAILVGSGAIAILLALLWWSLVFGAIVSAGVLSPREASICLIDSSGLCQAVVALCTQSHVLGVKTYSPNLLLIGLALVVPGLLVRAFDSRLMPKRR